MKKKTELKSNRKVKMKFGLSARFKKKNLLGCRECIELKLWGVRDKAFNQFSCF